MTLDGPDDTGLHVALLGMDGIGKSTLAVEIVQACRANGHLAEVVSWRTFIEQPGSKVASYPVDSLRNIWLESFRMYFGGARVAGQTWEPPSTYSELVDRGGTDQLVNVSVSDVHPSGPLAAALIELSANVLLHYEVILPLVDKGYIVVHESFGFKHLFKILTLVSHLDPSLMKVIEATIRHVEGHFSTLLAPNLGIHVSGAPELALRWRMSQSGQTGSFENLTLAGQDSDASFLHLQQLSEAAFCSYADSFGWETVHVVDESREVNRNAALAQLLLTPLGSYLQRSDLNSS